MITSVAAPARPFERPALSLTCRSRSTPDVTPFREETRIRRFLLRLQKRFLYREVSLRPFLLLALRPRSYSSSSAASAFDSLRDPLREAIDEEDVLLNVPSCRRSVLLLENRDADAAGSFFDTLYRRTPPVTRPYLEKLEVLVVPEGRPFQRAEQFLSYALGKPLPLVSH